MDQMGVKAEVTPPEKEPQPLKFIAESKENMDKVVKEGFSKY